MYKHPRQEVEAYSLSPFEQNSVGKLMYLPIHNSRKRYCTREPPSPDSPAYNLQSSATVLCSHNNSAYEDTSGSCVTDDLNDDFKHKIMELETVMMGPDSLDLVVVDGTDSFDSTSCQEINSWRSTLEALSRSDLRADLVSCAQAMSENDHMMAQSMMEKLRQMVSVSGEPIQRLGAYLLEGLVAQLASSGSSIYKALNKCPEPASTELLSYMHILYEVCPYFKFGYMSANGAIAEAMKEENRVHIVDFQIGQGSQWVTLIQAFAARPGGPPRIRITGIDDMTSAYARGGGLTIVGNRLAKLAKKFNVPFEFNAVSVSVSEVKPKNLGVRPGEALAVNFAFVLHHMPDESVCPENHRDRLLRMVKSLSPKVVTLVEQESNTNTAAFFPRFKETMNYYAAMFESIDVTLPRNHKQRINVEQHCLARDVVNIIACEGADRVERHELLGKWRSRFGMAGFVPYPLSPLVNSTIKSLLRNYSDKYRLEERDGALYLANAKEFKITSSPGSDITNVLLKTFNEACQFPTKSTVLIPKGEYKLGEIEMLGPCKAPIHIALHGTVKADGNVHGKDKWVAFRNINGFKLNGGGVFDGEGNAAWRVNNCHKTFQCKKLPISIRFDYVTDAKIRGITSLDAKNFHINVIGGRNMTFEEVRIIAPDESPNTDGIHLGRSQGIKIINSVITTGDDCISVGDGTKDLLVEKVTCGPGHGISIGSLGYYGHEQDVTGIKVLNCTLQHTDNGVRIKTWPSSKCATTASGIHFENIIIKNVSNPVLIDQEYCPWNQCNKQKPSSIKLVDISFKNIRGTSRNKDAVKLLCSKGYPCKNVEVGDINIKYTGADGPATFQCANVSPKLSGTQVPKACSSPVTKPPGQN
ncbi:unnamed protein product [Thlaspi arvense]|uniref:Uncharacterized protein n=1 Tax=Thlaspi arvense TaxID=13288 RepID=A0AAU9RLX0_THLAR|nr:unnamed protein product [Thlaspi arvense]